MKKLLAGFILVGGFGLFCFSLAQSALATGTPDTNTNEVPFWCGEGNGVKINGNGVSTTFTVPNPPDGKIWTLLVIKAGSDQSVLNENETFPNPVPGQTYAHSSGKIISHVILCFGPAPTTTTQASTTLPGSSTVPSTTIATTTTATTIATTTTATTLPTTTTVCGECTINTVIITTVPTTLATTTVPTTIATTTTAGTTTVPTTTPRCIDCTTTTVVNTTQETAPRTTTTTGVTTTTVQPPTTTLPGQARDVFVIEGEPTTVPTTLPVTGGDPWVLTPIGLSLMILGGLFLKVRKA